MPPLRIERDAAVHAKPDKPENNFLHVFHHIPKCGGTSLVNALGNWFDIRKDYREGWSMKYPPRAEVSELGSRHCLCGHFELGGYYLHERYPELLRSRRYRVFTFVRDPLDIRLSLYRYAKRNGRAKPGALEEHLFNGFNYIAGVLPADASNYCEVIDRYWFVGVMEQLQAGMDVLAEMIGKPRVEVPWMNRTRGEEEDSEDELTESMVARFKALNAVDYRIYDYCLERFHRLQRDAGLGSPVTGSPGSVS